MWRGSSVDYWTQTIDTNEKTEWADILCRTVELNQPKVRITAIFSHRPTKSMAKDPKLRPVQTATGWRVNVPRDLSETGKRQRRDFSTEKDAERLASKLRTRYRKGIRSALLTTEQALQAEQAIRLLEPLGISLIEAARTVQRRYNEATRRELFKDAWLTYVTEGELRWSAVYATTIGRIPDWVGP